VCARLAPWGQLGFDGGGVVEEVDRADRGDERGDAGGGAAVEEVDGGIDAVTAAACAAAGANVMVAGSSTFRAPNMAAAIRAIREA
jgi:ribulose-phosphate 3-epimerase